MAIAPVTALMAALVFCSTCSDVVGPGPDVELQVTLSQEVVTPKENVTIWITVHNPGQQDVWLGDRCPPLGFRVVDEDGRRVGPALNWESSFVCVGEIVDTVPAGGSIVHGFLWSPYFNYGSSGTPLPPGIYRIHAGFAGEPLRPPFSDRVPIQVVTE